MIRFVIVGSGSKGNATLVYDEDTLFQIDMGLPLKRVKAALGTLGKEVSDEKALLLTHCHVDHIGTIATLPSSIPTYASKGTLPKPSFFVKPEEPFSVGSFTIIPILLSHDAINTMGYIICHENEKLVYATDTGFLPDEDLPYMKGGTFYIIESNHDLRMLMRSSRPFSLKQRIKGDKGHLSNIDSALYVSGLVTSETKGIYLAHLSEECNTPELALKTYDDVFEKKGLDVSRYQLVCAKQWEPVLGGDL